MKWKTIDENFIHKSGFMNVKIDTASHPKLGVHQFYRVEMANWVNVVAIDKNDAFILVKQFRHGTKKVTYEVPAGAIDNGETPKEAAIRELQEETGYIGNPVYLGKVEVNPAFLNNFCYLYLMLDCQMLATQNLDLTEDIEIIHLNKKTVQDMLANECISHSLTCLALYKAFEYINKK
ncbi:NUDIX hydrolase [Proteinivorax tanatarense]|uniref:NUDIX hydrolase n=1 Tax=Proteinivorax tanatarense TaxID=1260629 RepID=A0AAU7VPP8_9FIRM